MDNFSIEPLAASHQKKQFDCNNNALNDYLHKRAKQDVERKLASCFVLLNNDKLDNDKNVLGYYTLSNASIPKTFIPENLAHKLPYQDIPVTLLGRLAVDVRCKGKGFGKILLIDALKRSFEISAQIGSAAIVVNPIDEAAVAFYLKFGFIELRDSGRMFLAMGTVKEVF